MDESERNIFEGFVFKELDSLNYFMDRNKDLSMDKLVMEFAVNYCKQYYNKDYNYYE